MCFLWDVWSQPTASFWTAAHAIIRGSVTHSVCMSSETLLIGSCHCNWQRDGVHHPSLHHNTGSFCSLELLTMDHIYSIYHISKHKETYGRIPLKLKRKFLFQNKKLLKLNILLNDVQLINRTYENHFTSKSCNEVQNIPWVIRRKTDPSPALSLRVPSATHLNQSGVHSTPVLLQIPSQLYPSLIQSNV